LKDKKIFIILGLVVIVSGVCILIVENILNKQLKQSYKDIANEHIITNAEESTEDTEESTEQSLGLASIEMLDSDQIAAEVGSYVDVLEIKDYDVLCYIYPDTDEESLTYGVGWYNSTKWIGEKGICAVAGHSSDTYNCLMNDIKDMKFMETFNVYDDYGVKHIYYVTGVYVVPPTAIGELYTESTDYSIFKIITCTNGGNDRLIIEGTEFTEEEAQAYQENYKKVRENDMLALLEEQETPYILSNYYEDREQVIEGNWHYVKQNNDYGFVNKNLNNTLQNITNTNVSVEMEEKQYDLSELER
jgi:LPXTG-site transpeptidase (sortase) family protein